MHSTGRNSSLFVLGRAAPNSPEGTPAPRIEMNNFKGMLLTEPSLSATGGLRRLMSPRKYHGATLKGVHELGTKHLVFLYMGPEQLFDEHSYWLISLDALHGSPRIIDLQNEDGDRQGYCEVRMAATGCGSYLIEEDSLEISGGSVKFKAIYRRGQINYSPIYMDGGECAFRVPCDEMSQAAALVNALYSVFSGERQ